MNPEPNALLEISEASIRHLAQTHLKPHQAEWYLLQRYGCTTRGIPPGLSCNALGRRLHIVVSTLHRNLRHAEQILQPYLQSEYARLKAMPTLVFVRETAPDCVSYAITLADGHRTRTVTDRTQREALRGR